MPILWRYLIFSYLRTFFLATAGFIAVLLLTCLREIARLISFGSPPFTVCLFTICQIPYFLPIAIPLSGLISSLFLVRRLSHRHELTSFRCAGVSLTIFYFPLLMIALILSCINLAIVSEVTPRARLQSQKLLNQMMTLNPLALFKKSHPFRIQNAYINMDKMDRSQAAEEVILVMHNQKNNRLHLLSAEKLYRKKEQFIGENVAIISYVAPSKSGTRDNLIIDNQKYAVTSAQTLSEIMQTVPFHFSYTYLPTKKLAKALSSPLNPKETSKIYCELMRRFFFFLNTYAFTFMGISLGAEVGKRDRKRGLVLAPALAALTFICSTFARTLRLYPVQFGICYTVPLVLIIFLSLWYQRKMVRGIE